MNLSKINPLGHLEQKHRTYRTIWISDIHLGSKGSQSEHLLEFLKYNDSEYLYLVGNIIDGWRLTKKWYWPQSHNDVIQKILRKARKGTKVFYIPGNHDEGSRSFIGLTFGDIKIRNQAFHLTAKEKKLWVCRSYVIIILMDINSWYCSYKLEVLRSNFSSGKFFIC